MSSIRKLLPLAAFLATSAYPPLLAQKPAPSSKQVEPSPTDATSWRGMAEEIRKLVKERDDWEEKAVACQARLQRTEDSLAKLNALENTAVFNDPEVQAAGNDVVVTAHLLNIGDQASKGTASFDLLRDNKVVASAKKPVSIAPGGDFAVAHRFPGLAGKDKLSAKVSFDP